MTSRCQGLFPPHPFLKGKALGTRLDKTPLFCTFYSSLVLLSIYVLLCTYSSFSVLISPFRSLLVLLCRFPSLLVLFCPYLSFSVLTCPFRSLVVLFCPYLSFSVLTCPFISLLVLFRPYSSFFALTSGAPREARQRSTMGK